MTSPHRRRTVLAGLFVLVLALAVVLLHEVIGTVFFAITVAYVLYPVKRALVARGLQRTVASAFATALAFLAVVALVGPLALILYQRRWELLSLLSDLPDRIVFELAEFSYVVDVAAVTDSLRATLGAVAVAVARQAPVLALKLFLFVFVVFALLLQPLAVRDAVYELVPPGYHDIVAALADRVRSTLFAIYVLQAATAAATFVIAFAVFWALGYDSPFALAVVSGILQFVPVLGPSILIASLAVFDLAVGNVTRAVLVAVVGTFLIGFVPDTFVRPRLAERTASIPGSVYFIGFVGGILSVGAIGFIAGPLVVALLVELVGLLSADPEA